MSVSAEALPEARPAPFSVLGVALLLGIGIAGFCAFLWLGATTPDRDRDLRGGSALSDSAVGFAAAVELLRARGVPVTVSRTGRGAPRSGLLVLTPPPNGGRIGPALLSDQAGPVLVVLPKWRVAPLAGHPGWVESRGLLDASALSHILPAAMAIERRDGTSAVLHGGSGPMERFAALPVGAVASLQTVAVSADWTPLVLDEAARPVLLRWTGHAVYVLADPDLLDTRGLASPDTAGTALAMLDALRDGRPIAFDVTLDGFGAPPGLLRLMFEPPLLGATLCGAAAGGLILLMALHRFGPVLGPEAPHALGKRALADNSAGLIASAGREPRMAEPYGRLVRGLAARDLGLPPRLDGAALDAALDAASRARGLPDWTGLAALAASVRNRADLLAAARGLHDWRRGMRRDHR